MKWLAQQVALDLVLLLNVMHTPVLSLTVAAGMFTDYHSTKADTGLAKQHKGDKYLHGGGEVLSILVTQDLRHVAARVEARWNATSWHHPLASHVEIR